MLPTDAAEPSSTDPAPRRRVLVIGLDATDRDAVDRLVAEGRMPNLAHLARDGWRADMVNPYGMLSGPVWPTIATGVQPWRNLAYTWRPLRSGTYRLEYRGPNGAVAHPAFWSELATRGVRSTVLDVPNVAIDRSIDDVQIVGWEEHDRCGNFSAWPRWVEAYVRRVHPAPTHDPCDDRGAAGELVELRQELLDAVDRKLDLVDWLLAQEPADVLTVVFSEGHCAGHQAWHIHLPEHPAFDATTRAEIGDVVGDVYEAVDRALGQVVQRSRHAGHDPTVMVILSHGIAPHMGAPHLFDKVLRAIDARLGPPSTWVRAREFARRAPNRAARLALRLTRRDFEHLAHYVDGSRRFFPVPNFPSFGAIRLNLEGREPAGRITVADAPATLDLLEREFLALRDAASGRPVVSRVVRPGELFEQGERTGMPDLIVEWDMAEPFDAVTSPTLGTIRGTLHETRVAGHRQDGRVYLSGPGITPGVGDPVRSVDVAPTVAALVGEALPDVDGEVMAPVATRQPADAARPAAARS